MPMSNPLHLTSVVYFASILQPRRILDVGIGMGSYGFLIRQFLDISQERLKKSEWQIQIDGVEIFEGYRNPVWDYAYSRVSIGDIRDLVDSLEEYDLILCNDVLEHFEREEARLLISQLLKLSLVFIATTPNREYPQDSWGGNEAERHLCLLDASDFPQLVVQKVTGITTCYICCDDESLKKKLQDASNELLLL
ncbi:MAG: class I SAM-dependent methyltransferase [Stigonema ocellatum SAG 48.90 = DSM 106950]|nr:class I SAM-dependent methyltransferase [Stigonema ocellatum SAG 48.90 = DSM 106950]